MNQCREEVQLSAESVVSTTESNLIKNFDSYVCHCCAAAKLNCFYLVRHGNSTTYGLGLRYCNRRALGNKGHRNYKNQRDHKTREMVMP